jgi:hypothetical protein
MKHQENVYLITLLVKRDQIFLVTYWQLLKTQNYPFRVLYVRQIKNKVLYNLGEYFCVNNTDQKDQEPPPQTGAV